MAADAGAGDGSDIDAGLQFGHAPSPLLGQVVFNEVLVDGTTEGDPNGDGDADPVEDQFVEIVNAGTAAVALDGFTLVDRNLAALPRHTFGSFTLAAGKAAVVFGGGDAPAATAGATFFAANAEDQGIPFGLNLVTPASYLLLLDPDQRLVAAFCYGDALPIAECALTAAADQSLTRSPDVSGGFVPHTGATGSGGAAFSVGTRVDGTWF
ncbi:MAG: lamin tail domain-containing protein [Deltaproteobacteria bacterium]|nr:lamin tail domain-containing protein [Deltaproteobacteria bacterium]